jgi:hypothetical protein
VFKLSFLAANIKKKHNIGPRSHSPGQNEGRQWRTELEDRAKAFDRGVDPTPPGPDEAVGEAQQGHVTVEGNVDKSKKMDF